MSRRLGRRTHIASSDVAGITMTLAQKSAATIQAQLHRLPVIGVAGTQADLTRAAAAVLTNLTHGAEVASAHLRFHCLSSARTSTCMALASASCGDAALTIMLTPRQAGFTCAS